VLASCLQRSQLSERLAGQRSGAARSAFLGWRFLRHHPIVSRHRGRVNGSGILVQPSYFSVRGPAMGISAAGRLAPCSGVLRL
jgi:hypothetical protein